MILRRTLALIWTVVILALHSIPRAQLLQVPGGSLLVYKAGVDKLAHIVLFVILDLLWSRCFPRHMVMILASGVYDDRCRCFPGW